MSQQDTHSDTFRRCADLTHATSSLSLWFMGCKCMTIPHDIPQKYAFHPHQITILFRHVKSMINRVLRQSLRPMCGCIRQRPKQFNSLRPDRLLSTDQRQPHQDVSLFSSSIRSITGNALYRQTVIVYVQALTSTDICNIYPL